jgi:hypothetical protein
VGPLTGAALLITPRPWAAAITGVIPITTNFAPSNQPLPGTPPNRPKTSCFAADIRRNFFIRLLLEPVSASNVQNTFPLRDRRRTYSRVAGRTDLVTIEQSAPKDRLAVGGPTTQLWHRGRCLRPDNCKATTSPWSGISATVMAL